MKAHRRSFLWTCVIAPFAVAICQRPTLFDVLRQYRNTDAIAAIRQARESADTFNQQLHTIGEQASMTGKALTVGIAVPMVGLGATSSQLARGSRY